MKVETIRDHKESLLEDKITESALLSIPCTFTIRVDYLCRCLLIRSYENTFVRLWRWSHPYSCVIQVKNEEDDAVQFTTYLIFPTRVSAAAIAPVSAYPDAAASFPSIFPLSDKLIRALFASRRARIVRYVHSFPEIHPRRDGNVCYRGGG